MGAWWPSGSRGTWLAPGESRPEPRHPRPSQFAARYSFGVVSWIRRFNKEDYVSIELGNQCLAGGGYHVDPFQVSSQTPLTQPRFDLDAKTPPGATKEQFRAMMQNLLAERFHLKLHIESREFPGYELVVSKAGLKLMQATGFGIGQDDKWSGRAASGGQNRIDRNVRFHF